MEPSVWCLITFSCCMWSSPLFCGEDRRKVTRPSRYSHTPVTIVEFSKIHRVSTVKRKIMQIANNKQNIHVEINSLLIILIIESWKLKIRKLCENDTEIFSSQRLLILKLKIIEILIVVDRLNNFFCYRAINCNFY